MQTQKMPTALATSIKIPGKLKERIQHLAKSRKRTPHALMVQAIENYVDREEKREALRQEARAAHDNFVATGLHLTGEEIDEWLDELAKGNDVEPPKCHV